MAEERRHLVVINAPGDAHDAVSVLLSALPSDIPAPILLHVPGGGRMTGELSGHTEIEVASLQPGETPLRPGVLYLAPEDRGVDVKDGVATVRSRRNRSKSGDRQLVRSAAETYGENLVGIFLRGLPPDAAQEVYEVSARGGTVVVQGRGGHAGLPTWLPPTRVDIVAPLEQIGRVAYHLLRGESYLEHPDDEETFRALLEDLREEFGIDFSGYKRPTVMRRLTRRMAETAQESLQDYTSYLQAHPEESRRLVSSFLIKVTEFFRDPQLFDYLREHILPQMIEEARRRDRELRIWSAGCATGEEAYSLAILVADLLGSELDDFRVRIFATDLDEDAIEFARHGIYPPAAVAGLPPDLVQRQFVEVEGEYQIKKRVRGLCVFGVHDLGERAPFPRIDILVCRNVLIYFTTEAQRRVLQLFAFSLRTGGYLVLGKSETPSPLAEYFVADHGRLKIYRRRGDRMLIPPARIKETTPLLPIRHPHGNPRADTETRRAPRVLGRPALRSRADDVFHRLPIGIVTVDAHYDIVTINATARALLRIHGTAIGEDFIHQAQDIPARELRAAIDAALRGEETTMNDLPIVEPSSGMTRYLRLTTVPDGRPEDAPGAAVLVLAMEMTEEVEERRRVRLMLEERQEEAVQLEEQVARLTAANGELLAANQELTVQNMELSSANEEFLVGNEELQAAAEEVETLNEELQATNEELDTLNEELQATVEELNATNEDLQARSVELQELAVSLEAQRASIDMERSRLQAILANMSDGVLVVDSAGNRILTNAAYDAVFPPGESVEIVDQSGRPIPTDETPEVRARRGETFSMEFGLPGTEGRQRWFEANGSPVHGPDGGGDGVVVIRDISARSLQRLQDEFLATATHELRTPLTVLNGYLSMMRRELERNRDGARLTEYLANAHHQVSRLEGLIRDLADVARLQDGHIQLSIAPVDALDIADRVVQAVRAMGDSPPLALRVPEEPLLVSADAGRLEQVLMNLVTNAVTHASGTDRIDIRLYRDGENAVLCVQDFGPGIAPEHLANLFTRFYRVDTQDRVAGLGLGLYISRELVTAHGGTLTVDSEEGRGTTFTLTLPLAQE